MATARTLITQALQEIGVIAPNESPSATDANTGLLRLQGMIDSWNADEFALPSTTRTLYVVPAGTSTVTIGPAATIALAARPIWFTGINSIGFPAGTVGDPTIAAAETHTSSNRQTVLTLTALPLAVSDTSVGGGSLVYTLPAGTISVASASASITFTTTSVLASTLNASVALSWGVGTVKTTTQASGTLVTTQQNAVNVSTATSSATINVAGSTGTGTLTGTPSFDGTVTPIALYLNLGVPTATDIDGDATVTASGTITITWATSVVTETALIQFDDDGYTNLPTKFVPADTLTNFWYNGTTPTGTLFFYPQLTAPAQIAIYAITALAVPTVLDDTVIGPAGYQDAYLYELALRLCGPFARTIPPLLPGYASASYDRMKEQNMRPFEHSSEQGKRPSVSQAIAQDIALVPSVSKRQSGGAPR